VEVEVAETEGAVVGLVRLVEDSSERDAELSRLLLATSEWPDDEGGLVRLKPPGGEPLLLSEDCRKLGDGLGSDGEYVPLGD
jgi:hypothetical protein